MLSGVEQIGEVLVCRLVREEVQSYLHNVRGIQVVEPTNEREREEGGWREGQEEVDDGKRRET